MTLTYADITRESMQSLGVYRAEFEPVIEEFCRIRREMDEMNARFDSGEYQLSSVDGKKKSPELQTLETLRKDFLSYASQLGLTPHGLKKINDKALAVSDTKNALAAALEELSE